jgi:hypothetical protein
MKMIELINNLNKKFHPKFTIKKSNNLLLFILIIY